MSGIWIVGSGICTALVFGRVLPAVLSRFLPVDRAAVTVPVASLTDFSDRHEIQHPTPSKAGEFAKMLVPMFAVICVMIAVVTTRTGSIHNSPDAASVASRSVDSRNGSKAGSCVSCSSSAGSESNADSTNGAHADPSHSAYSGAALEDQVKMLQSKIASLQSEQSRQAEVVKSLKQQARPPLSVLASNWTGGSSETVFGSMFAEPEAFGEGGITHKWDSQTAQQALTNSTYVIVAGTHVILPGNQSLWPRQDPWNYITSSISDFKIYPGIRYSANSVALYDPCSMTTGRSSIDGQYLTCPSRSPLGVQ